MAFDMNQAGMSSTFHYKEDHPSVFRCKDFQLDECCEDCHEKGHVIAIYPWGMLVKAPDLSLGLRAEVCCGLFHAVRELPRSWWINRYGEKSGWSEADCKRLIEAPADRYYKIIGEIASKHFTGTTVSKRDYRPAPGKPVPRKKGCPSCGGTWDGIACDNCGYS